MGTVALSSGQGTLGEMDPVRQDHAKDAARGWGVPPGVQLESQIEIDTKLRTDDSIESSFFIVLYRVIILMNAPIH
jgi:hypothetical protein